MKLLAGVTKRLKEIMKEKNLNQYKLFKLTEVPQSTISTILHGDIKTIQLDTLYDFCAGLNIEFSEFFDVDYLKIENIDD